MHANCEKFVMPKSNTDYWEEKLRRNQLNDFKKIRAMEEMGWKVIIIWECELTKEKFEDRMQALIAEIVS
jgi:DNA mismatch endonuclease (patch repair protein)